MAVNLLKKLEKTTKDLETPIELAEQHGELLRYESEQKTSQILRIYILMITVAIFMLIIVFSIA